MKARMGMTWFRKEDWPRWLEIDPDFQPDYDHWLRRVEAVYEELRSAGVNVVKIEVCRTSSCAGLRSLVAPSTPTRDRPMPQSARAPWS